MSVRSRVSAGVALWATLGLLLTAGAAAAQGDARAGQDPGAAPAPEPKPFTSEDTRLTMGVESVGASSQDRTQRFMIDFMLTAPLSRTPITHNGKPSLGAWFNARFSGVPTQSVNGVKQFVGGFEKSLVSGDTSALFNALTFKGGVEFGSSKLAFNIDQPGEYQFQVLAIAAMGFTTTPPTSPPPVFDITEQARERFVPLTMANRDGIKYIGFTQPDRQRFYSQWEVGVRLKTHHFECTEQEGRKTCGDRRVNFPGIIDVTLGQNAGVTGGIRRGSVVTIDAFYPLPTDSIAKAVYLFGTAHLHRVKALNGFIERPPVILRGAAATVQVPSPELYIHTLTPDERTRDDWKFGVGVDLVRLFAGGS